jgi:pimeloyl-ACP methyl ester carboxylesterase
VTPRHARSALERAVAFAMDGTMCGIINLLQLRLRKHVCSCQELESYLSACSVLSREEFYRTPPAAGKRLEGTWIAWDTPILSGFLENNRPRARVQLGSRGASGPTVLLLHALMSASDFGYLRLARWFNERGWNAVFPHLPFHYSRTPRGYLNGELAITANLVRNSETLRQGVIELRQLLQILREGGSMEFGILGTSFGGWNGALLSLLEPDFRFVALIQPIVNIEHAIWQNPASVSIRRLLRSQGIQPGESARHAHLSSPLHGTPLCGAERVVITAGLYDSVSPASELLNLKDSWPGAKLLEVRQGHFGYRALRETLGEIRSFL